VLSSREDVDTLKSAAGFPYFQINSNMCEENLDLLKMPFRDSTASCPHPPVMHTEHPRYGQSAAVNGHSKTLFCAKCPSGRQHMVRDTQG